jgi:hypothetical protein
MFKKGAGIAITLALVLSTVSGTTAAIEKGSPFAVLNSSRGTGNIQLQKGEQILFSVDARGFTHEKPTDAIYSYQIETLEGKRLKCENSSKSTMACEALEAGTSNITAIMYLPGYGNLPTQAITIVTPGNVPFAFQEVSFDDGLIKLKWTPLITTAPYKINIKQLNFQNEEVTLPTNHQTSQNGFNITAQENRRYFITVEAEVNNNRTRTITEYITTGTDKKSLPTDQLVIFNAKYINGTIQLDWNKIPNTQGYKIDYKVHHLNGTLESAMQDLLARENTYTISAEPNKIYKISVEADKGNRLTTKSNVTVQTSDPNTPVGANKNKLAFTNVSINGENITVQWNGAAGKYETIALEYNVVDRTSSETITSGKAGNFKQNQYSIPNVILNSAYQFTLQKIGQNGRVLETQKRVVLAPESLPTTPIVLAKQPIISIPSTAEKTLLPEPIAGFEDKVHLVLGNKQFTFTDITPNTLVGQAAISLAKEGIVGGFADRTFRADKRANRAEAAKFLVLSRGEYIPNVYNDGRYTDVPERDWYVKYIMAADNQGIIQGFSDGTYLPNRPIETAEFLKMLTATFNLPTDLPHAFQDDSYDGAWFWKYAGIVQKYNLFLNQDTRYLNPRKQLTRGDIALAIFKLMSQLNLLQVSEA